ncbi:MAG: ribonuclease III [Candidatus Magasanikbacteria bacterium]
MEEIEKKINNSFEDPLLLKEALTHRSYLNEHADWPTDHNERLEFLGDAVLELVVTDRLFDKYPNFEEGKLTNIRAALVDHDMLSKVASELELERFIFLSKGEREGRKKAREAILANTVEALIGAVYKDKGYDRAKDFIQQFILSNLEKIVNQELYKDPKSVLQEVVQEKKKVTPHYKVLEQEGPEHKKTFTVGVYFQEDFIAEGRGASKQEAESDAAKKALKKIRS